jgi:hypothetical protein
VLQRCRLGIEHETLNADRTVHSTLICPSDQEGGPQVAHGGWTAGVLDELSGHALLLRGMRADFGERRRGGGHERSRDDQTTR